MGTQTPRYDSRLMENWPDFLVQKWLVGSDHETFSSAPPRDQNHCKQQTENGDKNTDELRYSWAYVDRLLE